MGDGLNGSLRDPHLCVFLVESGKEASLRFSLLMGLVSRWCISFFLVLGCLWPGLGLCYSSANKRSVFGGVGLVQFVAYVGCGWLPVGCSCMLPDYCGWSAWPGWFWWQVCGLLLTTSSFVRDNPD